MGELSKVIFKEVAVKEIEVLGHKIVIRGLTTRDSLEMDVDYTDIMKETPKAKEGEETKEPAINLKAMIQNMIEVLSSIIVSIDGITPDNRNETKAFLLDQEQSIVSEIFSKADVYSTKAAEEIKN